MGAVLGVLAENEVDVAQLADNVFLAPVRGRVVVLDLVRDKYIALAGGMAEAALKFAASLEKSLGPNEEAEQQAVRQALAARGVLGSSGGRPRLSIGMSPPALPSRTLWPTENRSAPQSATGTLAVLAALGEVSIALKALPFHMTISRVGKEPVRAISPHALQSEQQLLDEFFAVRPWFPIAPICRLDAFALCLHLRRNGHQAHVVFGAKLEPFKAHCWVQCGDRAINEPHEIVAWFTPIMMV